MKYIQRSLVIACVVILSSCGHKDSTFGDLLKAQGHQTIAFGKQWEKGDSLIKEGQKLKEKGNKLISEGLDLVKSGEAQIIEGSKLKDEANIAYKKHMASSGIEQGTSTEFVEESK